MAAGQAQGGDDFNLRLLETPAHRGEVDVYAPAPLEHHQAADAQVELVEGELCAAVTERADDASPVGIASVHGGLDEAGRGDGAGRGPRLGVRLRALDADRNHPGRAFTVARD